MTNVSYYNVLDSDLLSESRKVLIITKSRRYKKNAYRKTRRSPYFVWPPSSAKSGLGQGR